MYAGRVVGHEKDHRDVRILEWRMVAAHVGWQGCYSDKVRPEPLPESHRLADQIRAAEDTELAARSDRVEVQHRYGAFYSLCAQSVDVVAAAIQSYLL